MDCTRRYAVQFVRPSDATAYAVGDEISSSPTAGSVVRTTVDLRNVRRARVVRAGVAITPASSNLVIAACDFSLLVFKTADVPAAVGDNVAFPITGVQRGKASKFSFVNTAWTQPTGALTAGTSGFQEVVPAFAVGGSGAISGNTFDFGGDPLPLVAADTGRQLTIVLQAQGTWTPGAVANTFDIVLDIEVEE